MKDRESLLSWQEKENNYSVMSSIIDTLDITAINELMEGTGKDIENLFDILLEETNNIVNLRAKEVNTSELNYLPSVKKGYEHYLRCSNLNYFISSCLPGFDQSWHTVEWAQMVQIYKYLCVIAARDHCFGENTPILMFDGTIKRVQNIKEGDIVMGPDSSPRKVLDLHSGEDFLYKVNQTRGDSYVVNKNHILSLYKRKEVCGNRNGLSGKDAKRVQYIWYSSLPKLEDLPIQDYKKNTKNYRNNRRGYKVCIKFPEKSVGLDPYYLGLWLGDGTTSTQSITSADKEIEEFLLNYSKSLEYNLSIKIDEGANIYTIVSPISIGRKRTHKILKEFRKYNLLNNKHIPENYLVNSKEVRLKLLAGLIDSDGSMSDNIYYYTSISEKLILDIKRLADGLGFRTYLTKYTSFVKYLGRDYENYSLTISGLLDQVPVLLSRKKIKFNGKGSSYYKPKSLCNYDISILSNLEIEKAGSGKYYGFEVDKDSRFCLGDSTVVHNSKSFLFSFANILWGLYRYERPTQLYVPSLEIQLCKETMLITNEFSLAKRLLKKVKLEIETNPIFQERMFPDSRAAGWGETALTCKNGSEMTLSSFHSSNRGPHPGRIIVDDFLDKSALYSKAQREKFREVFTAEVMNMILPQGQVCAVGTPFHERDLYYDLKQDPNWKVFEYPAIFPDGRILYDGRYNYEALVAKRKSLGSLIFSREILVKPVTDNVSIFPYSILEVAFINMQNLCMVQNRQSYPVKFKKVAVGCDFALSANVGADYTVYSVVGLDSLEQIHLIHSCILHGAGYNEQILNLQRICNDFQPESVVMETNGFQKVMAQNAKDRGIQNVIEFSTNGFNKKDLYEGVPSLAVMFETGVIKFPRGNEESLQITDSYCSELNSMAFDDNKGKLESVSEHDDKVMSLFFGIKGLKTINSEFRVSMIEEMS